MTVYETIPAHKMRAFDEILKATGGSYLGNPMLIGCNYRVGYATGPDTMRRWGGIP